MKNPESRLLRLEQLGVPVGRVADPSPEPERLILKQIEDGFARLYELPSGEIAVVIPSEITVLMSGLLIIDRELTTSLDDFPLEFTEPTEWEPYKSVIDEYPYPSENLTYLLTSRFPLRPCQRRGVIIANGWSAISPQYHENTRLTAQLFLRDERQNEICAEFVVRLDRSLKLRYERKQAIRRENARSTARDRRTSPVKDLWIAPEKEITHRKDSDDVLKPERPN